MQDFSEKITQFTNLEFLMFVLDEMADKKAREGGDVIKLTLGKAQEPLNSDIVAAWCDAVSNPDKRNLVYPEGLPALKEKIANWYASWGTPIKTSNIVINTGTSPFFKDLFRMLLHEGDEILLPTPYYSVYYMSALLTPAKIKFYKVNPETLKIDMDDFKRNYDSTKTKIVVMCSPGNPYGNVVSGEELKDIIHITSNNTLLLSDEIYRNTGFYGEVPSILNFANTAEIRDRIIITNSFSKGFRMYTSRVGFAVLPDNLLKYFRVLMQHTLLTTNPVEQYACIEALNHLDDVKELVGIYRSRKDYLTEKFSSINTVKTLKCDGGFYIVVDAAKYMQGRNIDDSFTLAKKILDETGVAVVSGSDFGLNTGLRISFTNLRFEEAIDRLAAFFTE